MAKQAIPLSELPVVNKSSNEHFSLENFQKGTVILMDKPLDWTSFDVVKYVRNRIPPKKVGHAGTLDPLATGLLILCSGKATKSIFQIQELPKTYTATIKFGESTPSYDAATEPDTTVPCDHLTKQMILEVIEEQFLGQISQVPPMFSAIKVKGERLYKLARKGKSIDVQPRIVDIHNFSVTHFNLPYIKVEVKCGKGTYIRSLAHDLGIALDTRAHLSELRRTKTGYFDVENALSVDEIDSLLSRIHSRRSSTT